MNVGCREGRIQDDRNIDSCRYCFGSAAGKVLLGTHQYLGSRWSTLLAHDNPSYRCSFCNFYKKNFTRASLLTVPVWPTLTTVPVSRKLHPWATFTHKAPFCVHTKPLAGTTQALINICRKEIFVGQQIWRQKRPAALKDKNGDNFRAKWS